MTGDEYQTLAHRTAATAGYTVMQALAVAGLGIAGEAGEVADLIKKEIGHGHPVDRQKILGELGDVLW
jgi:NTP pyrophosphatase (non-canonical NTP hydrolase)